MQQGIKVEDHLHLVHYVINKFLSKCLIRNEYDDLYQVGCEGLIRAAKHFDDSKGNTFSTYAVTCIIGIILRFNRDYRPVKEARGPRQLLNQIKREGLLDEPIDVIAEITGSSIKFVERALKLNYSMVSMDKVAFQESNDKMTIGEMIPVEDDQSEAVVNDFLLRLSERERKVVSLRMKGLGQSDIAQIVGCSQPNVGRILTRSAKKYINYEGSQSCNSTAKII